MKKMGQRILALELNGDCVLAAMADRSYKAFELVGVYEQERVSGETDLSGALERVVDAAGRAEVVVSSLPGEFVAKRLLALPFTDRRRLQQVVPFALEEHLPFAIDDSTVAFARVGRDESDTLVIAAAARRGIVREHLELLGRAGLDPKLVTLSTLALAEMLSRARNGSGQTSSAPTVGHLVVDIARACTSLVLTDAAGTPRALRTLSQGLDLHHGGFRATAVNTILAAVRQTLLAHGQEPRAELILAGGAAEAPGFGDVLGRALQAPVHDVGDFDYSPLIRSTGSAPKRFAGCIAMLLAEAPSAVEMINFREGEFAFRGLGGASATMRVPLLLAGAAIAAALLQFSVQVASGVSQIHRLDSQIRAIAAPALGEADPVTARSVLRRKITDMSKRLRLMGGSLGHGSPLDILDALSRALPPGLLVQIEVLQIDAGGMKLEGEADSFTTVDEVKRALERHDEFGQVKLDHAAVGSVSGKVDFHLSASLGD